MLIGIDASRANRNHKSGTEWYSYYLIRWLSKLDKDNQYILYSDCPLEGGLINLKSYEHSENSEENFEISFDKDGYQKLDSKYDNFRGRVLKWPFKYFWTQGRFSLEMIFNRPDILFIPAHTLPIIHPRRSVVTIHDIGFVKDIRLYEKEAMGPENVSGRKILNILVSIITGGKYRANSIDYLRWSTEFALKHAKKIITVSEFTKQEIVDVYKTKAEKIKVIHNGYNKDLFKKIDNTEKIREVLDKYGIDQPYLFYVGRIEKKKNIPALIEAFAIMRENNKDIKHKLVLAGDASFGYDETKYMMREFDLVNDILLPGWVDERDVPYLYNGADAFIFPSMYEGFGIPLLQAMACGAPIAASNRTSIPEVAGDAALLFNPDYVLSIADAMAKIINDQRLRDELIVLGQERIKDFSWEKCAKETLKEFNLL